MSLLIIPLLCILATSKIILQSDYSKSGSVNLHGNVFYNGIMFLTAALLFIPFVLKGEMTFQTLIFGIIMGVLSFAFQIFYICAFSCGEMSLTVIINNFSMLLPMFVSFVMFDEKFGIPNFIGTFFALISFILTVAPKSDGGTQTKKRKLKWLFFVFLTFLSNGMIAIDQKIYSMNSVETQIFEFVGTAYIVSAMLSLITCMIFKFVKNEKYAFRCNIKHLITFCISGCILGLFQCINTYAAAIIEGTVLYSTYNCGVSVLSVLVGKIRFKEHLTRKQYVGLLFGIFAIALLCL